MDQIQDLSNFSRWRRSSNSLAKGLLSALVRQRSLLEHKTHLEPDQTFPALDQGGEESSQHLLGSKQEPMEVGFRFIEKKTFTMDFLGWPRLERSPEIFISPTM